MLEEIASIAAALPDRAILAVDGVDGVGKTTFANQLRPLIEKRGRHVLRASVDGFHNPRAIRYRLGKSDPLGYFTDSYNYAELKASLLDPFRNGEGSLVTKCFDYRLDAPDIVIEPADSTAILVIDGIFLHRDDLRHYWNFSVFLDAPFVSLRRGPSGGMIWRRFIECPYGRTREHPPH